MADHAATGRFIDPVEGIHILTDLEPRGEWIALARSAHAFLPTLEVQLDLLNPLCTGKNGNSFRSAFFDSIRAMQKQGLLETGATFHGLRHTVAVDIRQNSEGDFGVAAALGDRSTAMAEIYGRDAKRQAAQIAALSGVQERFSNLSLETELETGARPAGGRTQSSENSKE